MIESGSSRLLELLAAPLETSVPEGWKTVAKMADEAGISDSHCRKLVKDALKSGVLEARQFRVKFDGKSYPVMHYKPKS